MKRVLPVLLALVLCLTMPVFAFADGVTIAPVPSSASVSLGDTFTVDVDLSGNPGVASFSLQLNFDRSAFEFVSNTKGSALSTGTIGITKPSYGISTNNDDTGNGTIFTATFKVKDDSALLNKSFSFTLTMDYDEFLDFKGNDVPYTLGSASVTVVVPAHDHTFGEPTYEWDGFTKCTATRACTVTGCTEVQTEEGAITSDVTKAAECGVSGETTYTATFMNTAFATQTKVDDTKPEALTHDWNEATYTWADDNSTCTATRTCKNGDHPETVKVDATPSSSANHGEIATTTYTAKFSAPFETQTKVVSGDRVPHTWGAVTYPTEDINTTSATVTARRDCTADDGGYIEDTVTGSVKEKVDSDCTTKGHVTYSFSFENEALSHPDATVELPLVDTAHTWKTEDTDVAWTWTGYTAAKATFTCANDGTHTTEVAATIKGPDVTLEPTCTATGKQEYTATVTFEGKTFTNKVEETIPVDDEAHTWKTEDTDVEWNWIGTTAATATFKCANDGTHTKEVAATIKGPDVTKQPTCSAEGVKTYTATAEFAGKTYTNTKEETIPVDLSKHDWGEPSYKWTGYTACHGVIVCKNDESHKIEDDALITSNVTAAATCTTGTVTEYTATFTKDGFSTQKESNMGSDLIPHSWKEPVYTWTDDFSSVTASRTCSATPSNPHSETETVKTTVTSTATCDEAGVETYTATFKNSAFTTQVKTKDVAATGHDWGEPTWTWADDNSSATAKFVCANDETHVQTLTATISKETNAEPTCTEPGGEVITAKVTFTGKDYTDVKTVGDSIPALGHDWGEPEYKWAADYSTVTATRTCKTDSTHVEDVKLDDLKITSAVTKAAAVGTPGETTYTATFTVDGKKVTLTTVDKTKPAALEEIKLIEGNSGTAYVGSTYTFKSNAEYADFIDLYIDAKVVNKANYDVKEGSTVVTLHADFVKTLKAGAHTVAIVSRTGSATGTFSVSLSPKTADTNLDVARLGLIVVLAAFGTFGIFTVARKRKTH